MDVKKFAVCSREYGTVMIAELSDYESELHLSEFIHEKKVIDLCGPLSLEPVDYLKEESLTENMYGKVLVDHPFFLNADDKLVYEDGKANIVKVENAEKWKRWI